jgi:hypothetical protein
LEAIRSCVRQGAKIIVIDSMTHEHSGPGGYLLTQEAEVERMAGQDYAKRERVKMAGWIKPSGYRQRMITGILQLNVSFVFCFRAKEKTKPKPGGGILELGFMPIAGEELLFEMTVNCLLMPKSNGVPTWRSDQVGEKMMMKLPRQFQTLFADGHPLDEATGRALAQWAAGTSATPAADSPAPSRASSPGDHPESGAGEPTFEDYDKALGEAAAEGTLTLQAAWKKVPREYQQTLKAALDKRHKLAAQQADAAKEQQHGKPVDD